MKTLIKSNSIIFSSNYLLLNTFTLFIAIFPAKIKAQLPAPSNFHYHLEYIHISESGLCGEKILNGPAYCSSFQWEIPDTIGITNQIAYYKIYNVNFNHNTDTSVIASVLDISYIIDNGYEGYLWVTAVYKDSNLESNPSNIEINYGLPNKIQDLKRSESTEIYYNNDSHTITISDISKIDEVKIYDIYGKLIIDKFISSDLFQISNLTKGFYIVQCLKNNKLLIVDKITY